MLSNIEQTAKRQQTTSKNQNNRWTPTDTLIDQKAIQVFLDNAAPRGRTMTGRSSIEQVYPEAICEIHSKDALKLKLETSDWVKVSSRRWAITLRVLVTNRSPQGTIFIPFHFAEAAVNLLTLDLLDERAKIPDYKNTAVKIEKTIPPEGWHEDYAEPLLERGAIKDPDQVH